MNRPERGVVLCYACFTKFNSRVDEYPYCMCCGSGRTAIKVEGLWVSNVTGEVLDYDINGSKYEV